MDTQERFQSQGSGHIGVETTITVSDLDCILGSLQQFTAEAERTAEDALETVGRMLSTGSIAPEDVSVLTSLEELLDEGLERLETAHDELAHIRRQS